MDTHSIPVKDFLKKHRNSISEHTIETFHQHLDQYRNNFLLNKEKESEEHIKNQFNDLLKSSFGYNINAHKKIDSVIKNENDQIKVLIEFNTKTS